MTDTTRAWIGLGVASVSYVLILDGTAVAVAFGDLEEDFDTVARTTLAWVSTGFTVAIAALMLIAGRIADRIGWRRAFVVGMLVYAAAGIGGALAPNAGALIGARAVQGAAAALFTVTSFPLALPAFPPESRGLAFGWMGVGGALAALLGPVVGGNLVDIAGWRAVWLVAPPLCVLAALGSLISLDERTGPTARTDVGGAVLGGTGVAAIAVLILQRWLWAAPVAIVALAAFWARDRRQERPLVPSDLFADRRYTAALVSQLCTQIAIFAWFFATPLFLVNVWGWSTPAAGWALAVPMVLSFNSVPVGAYADRHGFKGVLVVGGLCAGAGPLVWVGALEPTESLLWLAAGLVLFGWGGGMVGITGLGAALNAVPDDRLTDANATLQTGRRLVQGVGAAVALAILGNRDTVSMSSYRWVWLFTGAGYVLSAAMMAFYPGTTRLRHGAGPQVFGVEPASS